MIFQFRRALSVAGAVTITVGMAVTSALLQALTSAHAAIQTNLRENPFTLQALEIPSGALPVWSSSPKNNHHRLRVHRQIFRPRAKRLNGLA